MPFMRLSPTGILNLGEAVAGCGRRTVMANGNSVKRLVGAVLLCEVAGGIGSTLTRNGLRAWYPKLQKPSFTPPDWVFGPVWTLLYAMMGVSLYLVSQQRGEDSGEVRSARILFWVQLVLNVLWSYVFFGRRSPGWALVEIGFLWIAIAATTRSFWKVSRTAALLLLPYILWVSFAVLLNYSIWRLNK
jgi:benzodiazapine receptor